MRDACAIISEEIYVRSQSLLRKIETGITWAARASLRQRPGKKDLRACLATGVGPVDGTLQNAVERVSPEPGTQAGSGSHREADGAVFLRGRRRASRRICSAGTLSTPGQRKRTAPRAARGKPSTAAGWLCQQVTERFPPAAQRVPNSSPRNTARRQLKPWRHRFTTP